MLTWIIDNAATIIISLLLLAVCAAIAAGMIKDRKKGKSSSCGCSCGSCPMSGKCHSSQK